MKPPIVVRSASPGDADRVFEMLRQFATSYPTSRKAFDQNYPALVASEDANLLVACDEFGAIGYALALRTPTLYANGDLWNLQELFVDANWRNRGVGHLLLDRVIADARERGAIEVVVVSRRAGPYYLRHGFTESASYFKLKITEPDLTGG